RRAEADTSGQRPDDGQVFDPAVPLGSRHLQQAATLFTARIIPTRLPHHHELVPMDGTAVNPPARPFGRAAVIALVLAAVTLAMYSPTFLESFEFINSDDTDYVTNNPHVQSGLNLDSIEWA